MKCEISSNSKKNSSCQAEHFISMTWMNENLHRQHVMLCSLVVGVFNLKAIERIFFNLFWLVLLFSLSLLGVHSFPTSKENVCEEEGEERTQNGPTRVPANAFHPKLICIKKQRSELLLQHPGYRPCI